MCILPSLYLFCFHCSKNKKNCKIPQRSCKEFCKMSQKLIFFLYPSISLQGLRTFQVCVSTWTLISDVAQCTINYNAGRFCRCLRVCTLVFSWVLLLLILSASTWRKVLTCICLKKKDSLNCNILQIMIPINACIYCIIIFTKPVFLEFPHTHINTHPHSNNNKIWTIYMTWHD